MFLLVFAVMIGFILAVASTSATAPTPGEAPRDILNNPGIKAPNRVKPSINFGKLPLYFIANKGQVNQNARFYARASRYTLWLTQQGLVFDSFKKDPVQRDVSRLMFVDANKNLKMVPVNVAKLKVNYFKGKDKSQWKAGVPTSQGVLYKNLYQNIDLKVYGIEKEIEYDWIVNVGGDPSTVKFRYDNVKSSRIDAQGNLLISTRFGELMHKRPVGFQEIGNKKIPVKVIFKRLSENTYGFDTGEYDPGYPLIIDPVILAYSTYLGGDDEDYAFDIAVDGSGYIYVTGITSSTDFPTLDEYMVDPVDSRDDAFVSMLDPSQNGVDTLLYSTYLGGASDDYGLAIAVDAGGNVYVSGSTESADFPMLNGYQTVHAGGTTDGFAAKLDPTLDGVNSLLYSTYLGGDDNDDAYALALGPGGMVYVMGSTRSGNFPLLGQYQSTVAGNYDLFITQMDLNQSGAGSLLYSTYLGGSDRERGDGIAVDGSGYVYVCATTRSTDFPIVNEYMTEPGDGSRDAVVSKLDITRGAAGLLYSTYLGGTDEEWCEGIAVDAAGNVYVVGTTISTDFPTLNEYMTDPGDGFLGETSEDIFVTKLDTTGSGAGSLLYSTYLGGMDSDLGYGIALDSSGYVYVVGDSYSTDFPVLNPYQTDPGDFDSDVVAAKLDLTRSGSGSLLYSTYLGGDDYDAGDDIVVDGNGSVYITGFTDSTDFPVINQYMTDPWDDALDAFVVKFSPGPPTVTTDSVTDIMATTAQGGGTVTDDGGAAVTDRGLCWNTNGNPTTADATLAIGAGTGSFTGIMSNLTANTTYYVRAYATNWAGTAYGNQVSFITTNASIERLPTVITDAVSNIKENSADCGGNVTSEGSSAVILSGLCWGTSPNPDLSSNVLVLGSGIGPFTGTLTGLTKNTTYYIRAFATNSVGTAYGNEVSFVITPTGSSELIITRSQLNYGSLPRPDSGHFTTGPQIVYINVSGSGSLNWTVIVGENAGWLSCTPLSGTGKGGITVSVDPSGLPDGRYTSDITIRTGSDSHLIPVYLTVYEDNTGQKPFGAFETPIHGSTVRSSVPVTGWVLDDIDIESVKIYRSPASGGSSSLVYVGDAVMVDGARPDVEHIYRFSPKSYQAGWGYMLLTNYLPNNGNGTFTLHAIVVDKEGHEVTLGSKTITCDNANAVKPFGAIDAPAQGGTASGNPYANFGWALTPLPNTIPTDGSTINVWIDGFPVGKPVYNQYREDVAVKFPGYNNSSGAVGYFTFDTTSYLNGVHTIAWSVEDNAGNSDGIGSRFFIIYNTGVYPSAASRTHSPPGPAGNLPYLSPTVVQKAPLTPAPVIVKTGYNIKSKGHRLKPDGEGVIHIQSKETERIEVHLGNKLPFSGKVSGYLLQGNRLKPLPVGSTLDSRRNIFYWQPCAGFYGLYRFVFVEKDGNGRMSRKLVNVNISAKY